MPSTSSLSVCETISNEIESTIPKISINTDDVAPNFQPNQSSGTIKCHFNRAIKSTARTEPQCFKPVDALLCVECRALDRSFMDPSCQGCLDLLRSSETTISHIFAILRQWIPQVQKHLELFMDEILLRGANANDRDSLTDMTLLMYACKGGASGIGDEIMAARVSKKLLDLGANIDYTCRWTDMNCLHYAAFFDVGLVLSVLLENKTPFDIDAPCPEYENGSALHIAAANLSLSAVEILLKFGADSNNIDKLNKKPIDCIPNVSEQNVDKVVLVQTMKKLLEPKILEKTDSDNSFSLSPFKTEVTKVKPFVQANNVSIRTHGFKVGNRVVVNGSKTGHLRYCGPTQFSPGIWAGVELENEAGKNNGSIDGVTYFSCQPKHGIFVPVSKISKVRNNYRPPTEGKNSTNPRLQIFDGGKVDVSHVSSRLTEAIDVIAAQYEIQIGDRVLVHRETLVSTSNLYDPDTPVSILGTIAYVGNVHFNTTNPMWYGIDLDLALGRHNGTVQGVFYFESDENCGIFMTQCCFKKVPASLLDHRNQQFSSLNGNHNNLALGLTQPLAQIKRSTSVKQICTKLDSALSLDNDHGTHLKKDLRKEEETCLSDGDPRCSFQSWENVSSLQFDKFKKKKNKTYLHLGQNVIHITRKEMATVKFIGRTQFAEGIWVGLEFRHSSLSSSSSSSSGDRPRRLQHDGTVEGIRYFSARTNQGIMVRARNVSVHGINGERLLKPEDEYPF